MSFVVCCWPYATNEPPGLGLLMTTMTDMVVQPAASRNALQPRIRRVQVHVLASSWGLRKRRSAPSNMCFAARKGGLHVAYSCWMSLPQKEHQEFTSQPTYRGFLTLNREK